MHRILVLLYLFGGWAGSQALDILFVPAAVEGGCLGSLGGGVPSASLRAILPDIVQCVLEVQTRVGVHPQTAKAPALFSEVRARSGVLLALAVLHWRMSATSINVLAEFERENL
jgi:hypothetical protein